MGARGIEEAALRRQRSARVDSSALNSADLARRPRPALKRGADLEMRLRAVALGGRQGRNLFAMHGRRKIVETAQSLQLNDDCAVAV